MSDRFVRILSPSKDGASHYGDSVIGWNEGSGYYIGDHLILTAGHVVYAFNEEPAVGDRDMVTLDEGDTHPSVPLGEHSFERYSFDTASSAFQFYDYKAAYLDVAKSSAYGTTSLPSPTSPYTSISSQIASTDSVRQHDQQLITGQGTVNSSDAGVVVFLNPADAFSPEMGLTSTSDQTKLSMHGDASTFSDGVLSANSNLGALGFIYYRPIYFGDSGSALLMHYDHKEFILGSIVSKSHVADQDVGSGLMFGNDSFYQLMTYLKASQASGNVSGSEPTNLIVGGSSDQTIHGTYRPDIILGRGGVDTIDDGDSPTAAIYANDTLVGGAGDDILKAGRGDDILWGGNERDDGNTPGEVDTADYSQLTAPIVVNIQANESYASISVLDGTGGTDQLHSIERIVGTPGNDRFNFSGGLASGHVLTLDANGGQSLADTLNFSQSAGFNMSDSGGVKTVTFIAGNGFAGGGQLHLIDFHTNIIGSAYDDTIEDDSSGPKTIFAGEGDDTVTISNGTAMIYGGNGDDTLTGGDGNDVLFGGAGHDVLNGGAGSDYLDGGDDTAWPGGDELNGGAGNDRIHVGQEHNAVVNGGAGDDLIDVSAGGDATVQFAEGDGHDVVLASGGGFTIDLTSLSKSDVHIVWNTTVVDSVSPSGDPVDVPGSLMLQGDLAIIDNSTGDSIVLQGISGLSEYWSDPSEAYSGPYVWLNIYLDGLVQFSDGTLSAEDFTGSDPAVAVTFGSVAAYESALTEVPDAVAPDTADTTGGTGDDNLHGGSGDDALAGNDGNDTFYASGGNDTMDGGSGDDVLNLFGAVADYTFSEDESGAIIVTSLSGVEGTMTLASIEAIYFATDNVTMTPGDLVGYHGTAGDDTLTGTAFDNQIIGYAGADTLSGGAGNDTIDGGDGNDSIIGQDGDDHLIGGAGDNVLDGGAGTDTVDYSAALAGVSVDLSAGTASDNGLGGADTITGVENVIGTAFDDTLVGDSHDNVLVGGAGDNDIDGRTGNDTLDYSAATNAVIVDLSSGSASDNGYGGTDSITGIENLVGSAWGDTITGDGQDNQITTGIGDDTINAGAGDDTIILTGGNDTVDGGSGTDTLHFAGAKWFYAFTDNLDGSITADDTVGGTGTIVFSNVEQVYFAGDESATPTENLIATTIDGTAGNDTLIGNGADNQINGLGGDDVLHGNGGNDILDGGDGFDVAEFAGPSSQYNVSLDPSGNLSVIDLTAPDQSSPTFVSIEALHFADDDVTINVGDLPSLGTSGDDTITGTDGNDSLYGGDGNDVLELVGGQDYVEGGSGNDQYLIGSASGTIWDEDGDDTYVYDTDSGNVTINDYGGSDVLQFGSGIDPSDVTIVQSENNYVISFVNSDSTITILDGLSSDTKIEQIQFADSTVWNL